MSKPNSGGGIFWVPIILVVLATTFIARAAAINGARYRTVWFLVLPISFIIGHLFFGMCSVALGFTVGLFGFETLGQYLFSKPVELSMLSVIFGDPITVPIFHIVVYQFIAWKLVVSGLTRHFAISIYDWAIQTIASDEDIHPYYVRERVSADDTGYAEADEIYLKSGKPPLLGLAMVAIYGTDVAEYYGDHDCYN